MLPVRLATATRWPSGLKAGTPQRSQVFGVTRRSLPASRSRVGLVVLMKTIDLPLGANFLRAW